MRAVLRLGFFGKHGFHSACSFRLSLNIGQIADMAYEVMVHAAFVHRESRVLITYSEVVFYTWKTYFPLLWSWSSCYREITMQVDFAVWSVDDYKMVAKLLSKGFETLVVLVAWSSRRSTITRSFATIVGRSLIDHHEVGFSLGWCCLTYMMLMVGQ
jgi:hypothetical protein